jgi:predicted RNase H-like HicB family nuclease
LTVTARSKGATAEQVRRWAAAAVRQAVVADAEDTEYLVATVEGCPGAWACGTTVEDAVAYLESVLIGWADLKLADGDTDIPVMEGISLALGR